MNWGEVLGRYIGALMDELARSGLRHLVFSPGSRSTPLILTAAEQGCFRLWRHIDERSAGFFALGLAKALGEPVALLCSSGTAAANFHPAVIEAYYDRVPLLILTADRPHRLRDVGAPQTIDQVRLYGTHAKWFFDMPAPDVSPESLRHVRSLAARAYHLARSTPAGPVHLNFPLEEPLIPEFVSATASARSGQPRSADGSRAGDLPYTHVYSGERHLSSKVVDELVDILASWRRGLIVCGPQRDERLAAAVTGVARRLGYPVLADPLSGVRFQDHDRSLVIDAYDALLRDQRFVKAYAPDVVLRFGAMPTSKALTLYLSGTANARQIVVDEGGHWRDPIHRAAIQVHADPVGLCTALWEKLPVELEYADTSWAAAWRDMDARAKEVITRQVLAFDDLFEGRVFYELGEILPSDATLYVGNSMPVRDLDSFMVTRRKALRCFGNRGANGIDGLLSSALGASAAGNGPVVLVVGDLSFYHDLNGLLAARTYNLQLTVVLVNNDGGGIFSFLPQAQLTEHFEELFGTPHGLDFQPVVAMYGGVFRRIGGWDQFRTAVQEGLEKGGLHVVEVPTERVANRQMHQTVWQAVSTALSVGSRVG